MTLQKVQAQLISRLPVVQIGFCKMIWIPRDEANRMVYRVQCPHDFGLSLQIFQNNEMTLFMTSRLLAITMEFLYGFSPSKVHLIADSICFTMSHSYLESDSWGQSYGRIFMEGKIEMTIGKVQAQLISRLPVVQFGFCKVIWIPRDETNRMVYSTRVRHHF